MALKDPRATQMGGLSGSCIGHDPSFVYAAGKGVPMALDAQFNVPVLGPAGSQQIEDPRYGTKPLRFEAATGSTADGLVMGATTYKNHTGKTVASGDVVLAALT
jgi:hypothetical protein